MTGKANPNRMIRFPLSWKASLCETAAAAANLRGISLAAWLREAAAEKALREHQERQRAEYQIRPGRYALVAPSLDALTGPAEGTVTPPLRLFWSSEDRAFDVSDPHQRRELYEAVLLEAVSLSELTSLLNRDLLIETWPQVYNRPVRRAWEDRHPILREAAARVAA